MPKRRADPKVAIESCHCERSEAISHCCTEIATHPAGARNDDRNQVIAKSSAVLAAGCKDEASNDKAGFSLVELLITALILTVVLFAIYLMYETNMTTATWGNKKAELQQNARVALDMMEREIRMAGYNPDPSLTGANANAIQDISLSPTTLTFITDVDGAADNKTEKVQYTYNATPQTITRSVWQWNGTGWDSLTATPEVVADGVSSLCLTYWDNTQPTNNSYRPSSINCSLIGSTMSPASVRRITIAITASGKAGRKTETFTFASDARLRNL